MMPELSEHSSDLDFVPSWITKEYIQTALKKYKNDENLKVIDVSYTPATAKGENYASVMIRAGVNYKCRNDSEPRHDRYIIKMPYEDNQFARDTIGEYDVYRKEMDIYENIIPKMVKMLHEIGDDDKLFAETMFVDYDHAAIIFEDLTVQSYVLVDRLQGMDMEHTKMVLRKLAKMHAASAVLDEHSPGLLRKFDRGLINRHTDGFRPYFEGFLTTCGKMVSEWGGEYKKYGEKLLKLKPMFMEYGKRVFDVDDSFFNALVHGDLWTNNVMFIYDEKNNLKDGLMIDFQYCVWGSPAIDIHYYFNTSLKEELRSYQQDELIQYYHTVLLDTLKKLGFGGRIPTLHQFWIQMFQKSFYGNILDPFKY